MLVCPSPSAIIEAAAAAFLRVKGPLVFVVVLTASFPVSPFFVDALEDGFKSLSPPREAAGCDALIRATLGSGIVFLIHRD